MIFCNKKIVKKWTYLFFLMVGAPYNVSNNKTKMTYLQSLTKNHAIQPYFPACDRFFSCIIIQPKSVKLKNPPITNIEIRYVY